MTEQPDKLYEWATDDQEAEKEEPPQQLQERGFQTGETADPGLWNELKNNIFGWAKHLKFWTENHDHEDDGTVGSMEKIDLEVELDYGDPRPGYLSSGTLGGGSIHTLNHVTDSADDARFRLEQLQINDKVRWDINSQHEIEQFGNEVSYTDDLSVDRLRPRTQPDDNEADFHQFLGPKSHVKGYAILRLVAQNTPADSWEVNWDLNQGFDPDGPNSPSDGEIINPQTTITLDTKGDWTPTLAWGEGWTTDPTITSSQVYLTGTGTARARVFRWNDSSNEMENWLNNPESGNIIYITFAAI